MSGRLESHVFHICTQRQRYTTQTRKDNVYDCDDNDNKDLNNEEYLSSSIS